MYKALVTIFTTHYNDQFTSGIMSKYYFSCKIQYKYSDSFQSKFAASPPPAPSGLDNEHDLAHSSKTVMFLIWFLLAYNPLYSKGYKWNIAYDLFLI